MRAALFATVTALLTIGLSSCLPINKLSYEDQFVVSQTIDNIFHIDMKIIIGMRENAALTFPDHTVKGGQFHVTSTAKTKASRSLYTCKADVKMIKWSWIGTWSVQQAQKQQGPFCTPNSRQRTSSLPSKMSRVSSSSSSSKYSHRGPPSPQPSLSYDGYYRS